MAQLLETSKLILKRFCCNQSYITCCCWL